MNKTVVITQPTYIPWLGYFEQIAQADEFVLLDNVQFEQRSWQCRNRLKGTEEQAFWLTVPVKAQSQNTPLQDILIFQESVWWKKHLKSVQLSLGKAPYFSSIFPHLEEWLSNEYEYLAELNIAGIKMIAALLGLNPEWKCASQLQAKGSKAELILNICNELGATRYYSSVGSKLYLDEAISSFTNSQIVVEYQKWIPCPYKQRGLVFVPYLSVIDVLMNIGPENTRSLIISRESR